MLLGSFPVLIFYIVPSVIAGGMMLRTGSPWETLAPIALAIAAALNVAGPTLAVYYLDQTVNEHWEELSQIAPDEEVLKLEREKYKKVAVHDGWSNWEGLNLFQKSLMFMAVVSMVVTLYLFFGVGSLCFYSFQVTTDLKEEFGSDATVFSVVKPLGWVGLGLNLFSVLLYILLSRLKARNTKHTLDKFEFDQLNKDFGDLYDQFAIVKHKDMKETHGEKLQGSFDDPVKKFLMLLFYQIMDKSFDEYLNQKKESKISFKSKFSFTATQFKDHIEKNSCDKKLVQSHLHEASEKIVASLRSNKVWVEPTELQSSKVKDDFVALMTANFCVIVHQLKRKVPTESLSNSKV